MENISYIVSDKKLVPYITLIFFLTYLTPVFIFHSFLDTYVPYLTSGYIIRSFLDNSVRLASISHRKGIFTPPLI